MKKLDYYIRLLFLTGIFGTVIAIIALIIWAVAELLFNIPWWEDHQIDLFLRIVFFSSYAMGFFFALGHTKKVEVSKP